jgi:hypothetical protein
MKKFNLIELYVELALRKIALFISSILSLLLIGACVKIANSDDLRFDEFIGIIHKDPIRMNVIYNVFFLAPILVSIFILVATRKSKELKQLIKKNKEL